MQQHHRGMRPGTLGYVNKCVQHRFVAVGLKTHHLPTCVCINTSQQTLCCTGKIAKENLVVFLHIC
jgi:hypothetical protein